MKNFFEGLILSIGFFTIFRIPYIVKEIRNDTYRFLALTISINGLLLSFTLIAIYLALLHILPPLHSAIIASAIYFGLYGFLHLEAFADIVDAIYASHSGKDTYEILKDSHVGAIGAIATFCFIMIKVTLLVYLLNNSYYFAIFAILFLSRLSATYAIYAFDFHPKSSFILSMKKPILKIDIYILLFLTIVVLYFMNIIYLFFFMLIFSWFLKSYLIKRVGFLNGDGLGFMIEVNEVLLLLCYIGLQSFSYFKISL